MSIKSRQPAIKNLNVWVTATDKGGRPKTFQILSPTSKHKYHISVCPIGSKVATIGFRVHCSNLTEHGCSCKGNGKTICKHGLAAVVKRIKWQGLRISLCETLQDARRLMNLFIKYDGKILEIVGNSSPKFAIVYRLK